MTGSVKSVKMDGYTPPKRDISDTVKTVAIGIGAAYIAAPTMIKAGEKLANGFGDAFIKCTNLAKTGGKRGIVTAVIAGLGTIGAALFAMKDKNENGKSDLLELATRFFK